jgi:hypothetical protein
LVLANALDKNNSLSDSIFEYTPAMAKDNHVLEIIELYKNHI